MIISILYFLLGVSETSGFLIVLWTITHNYSNNSNTYFAYFWLSTIELTQHFNLSFNMVT